jgi:hypothetical protein
MEDYQKTVERRLKRFPPAEAQALRDWLKDMPVGINLALQILEQLEDLSKITGQGATRLLRELLDEVSAKELSSKELGRKLRDAVDRRLHPQRHAHEQVFAATVKNLALPLGCRVRPPQNFEGSSFTLQVDFSSPDALQTCLAQLQDSLRARPELWRKLWES